MIGDIIGGVIGPPVADDAQSFNQSVNISASGSATLTLDAGKIVAPSVSGVVTQGAKSITKGVSIAASAAVDVTKAVTFTLAGISASVSASVTKNAGKNVQALASGSAALVRGTAKIVTVPVTALVSLFGAVLRMTSTEIIQKPIDYVLAGLQDLVPLGREYDIRPRNLKFIGKGRRSSLRRLSGGKPSYTTKTDNKGYE